jgi:iron complex outermembrane receptor protein
MKSLLTFTFAALTLGFFATGTSHAQQAATSSTSASVVSDSGAALQEIVVTAQRREENEQRIGVAMSSVSGDMIERANITRPGGLSQLIPALQISDDTGPYSIFYVRGVGNFAANGLSDPAVSFNFDGVTVAQSATSGFFYDLERVEVLKGPQGTLYGRNATGGVINVITQQPVLNEFQAGAQLQFGNFSANRQDAMLNLPLGEIAAMRVAGYRTVHDGYMADGTDDQDDSGGRITFRVRPSDMLNMSLMADFSKVGGQASGGTVSGVTNPFVPAPTFSISDRLGFFSPAVESFITSQPNFLNGRFFAPFENVNSENNKYWGITGNLAWTTPVGTLTFIPAYRDSKPDYTSFATGVMLRENSHDKQTTMELRFASNAEDKFNYVVGYFYLNDPNSVPRYDVNQQSVITFQQYDAKTLSNAAFASLSYAFVPGVRLTGGARYTRDTKDFSGGLQSNSIICLAGFLACPTAGVFPYSQLNPAPPLFFNPDGTITTLTTLNNRESATYSKVTWRAGIDWDITDQNLLYASVETGFKSGGFFFSSDQNFYQPETITAYTIGSKNRFFDQRLQANLELFYWKYHNQQISHLSIDSLGQLIFPTENIGEATFKGAELSLQARPWRHTLASADVQFNDGVYDSFVYHTPNQNGGVGNGTGCPNQGVPGNTYTVDCSGMTPPYTPRWTISAGLQQTMPLPEDAKLVGSARVHYQSSTLTGLEFLPVEYQPGYSMWDFDLTYYTRSEKFFVGAYVNNAFDKTALSFSFPTPISAFMTATLQHPRTFGGRIGVNF